MQTPGKPAMQNAEQLFAQARIQQEMQAAAFARQKAVRRRWLFVGMLVGPTLGGMAGAALGESTLLWSLAGCFLGPVVALVAGRYA